MSEGKLFVYGTLKMGGRFAEMYSGNFDPERTDVLAASVKGKLFDLGSFPGVKLSDNGEVHGELHGFKDIEKILPIMDRIEGFVEGRKGNLFERVEVEVVLKNGSSDTALMYVYNGETNPDREIENGVWKI